MRGARGLVGWMAAGFLGLLAAAAWAQDYTVKVVQNQWVDPPATKTCLNVYSHSTTTITLPFDFPYYGSTYNSANVGDEAFLQISPKTKNTSSSASVFPTSYDGTIAPAWYYHLHGNGGCEVNTFTSGTAPNRVFYVTWENAGSGYGIYAQVQLHETTGRIVMAYKNGGSWPSGFYMGIQAVGSDRRFVVPDGSNSSKNSQPASDFQLDPVLTKFTGRVLMDKLVSDASGIGNSVAVDRPVGGARVELRNSSGTVVAAGTTDANGNFTINGMALDSAQSGTLRIATQGESAILSSGPATGPITFDLPGASVSFKTSTDLGVIKLDTAADPSATIRAPLNILAAIQRLYEFARARSNDPIPVLAVYYDAASSQGTQYTPKTSTSPAVLKIGSPSSSNPDAWDDDVVGRAYGLHVYEALTGTSAAQYSLEYDQVTTAQNGMAAGFALYAQAAVSGDPTLVDGLSKTSATVIDLDEDEPDSRRGPDVAGWVGMALFDLVDDDNEVHDEIDGTGGDAGAPLSAVDVLTKTDSGAQTLYEAFVDQGGDGPGAARDFIHHGLLPDDRFEANDSEDEAAALTAFPFLERNLVLNVHNEDWYEVAIPAPVTGLNVDVVFDNTLYDTRVVLQVFAANGSLVGDGTPARLGDPVRLVTGALAAGDYVVRVAYDGGGALATYALQAYESLAIVSGPLPPWTITMPYSQNFTVRGGIPPYSLSASPNAPPGLTLNDAFVRVTGAPTRLGDHRFILVVQDSADPSNRVSQSQAVLVNDRLVVGIGPFAPIALGRATGFRFSRTGGTDPLVVTATTPDALPEGLVMSDVDVRVTGTANAPGSARTHVEAVDAAGDAVAGDTTIVVCPAYAGKDTPAPLQAGDAACGWSVDAVKGTTISASVKTAKKQPKRALAIALVDVAGKPVEGGTARGGNGKASVSRFVVPETGRYFVVVSSSSGDATQLTATAKAALPKKQAGSVEDFDGSDVFEIKFGALAGARFSLQGRTDVKELGVNAQALVAPDGRVLLRDRLDVTEKANTIRVAGECDASGTWTLRITPKPGPARAFQYTISIVQPKGGAYSAD